MASWCGLPIVPRASRVEGIAYALSEELIVKEGRTQNPSLENYELPMTPERVLKG